MVRSSKRKGRLGGEEVAEKADMLGLKVAGRQHWRCSDCPLEGSEDVGSHLVRSSRFAKFDIWGNLERPLGGQN